MARAQAETTDWSAAGGEAQLRPPVRPPRSIVIPAAVGPADVVELTPPCPTQRDSAEQDIVRLNVGGKHFMTTLSTLRGEQIPPHAPGPGFVRDNMLVRLVENDRHGHVTSLRDAAGHFFIDRGPRLFKFVLEYLQTGRISSSPYHGITVGAVLDELAYYQVIPPLSDRRGEWAAVLGPTHLSSAVASQLPRQRIRRVISVGSDIHGAPPPSLSSSSSSALPAISSPSSSHASPSSSSSTSTSASSAAAPSSSSSSSYPTSPTASSVAGSALASSAAADAGDFHDGHTSSLTDDQYAAPSSPPLSPTRAAALATRSLSPLALSGGASSSAPHRSLSPSEELGRLSRLAAHDNDGSSVDENSSSGDSSSSGSSLASVMASVHDRLQDWHDMAREFFDLNAVLIARKIDQAAAYGSSSVQVLSWSRCRDSANARDFSHTDAGTDFQNLKAVPCALFLQHLAFIIEQEIGFRTRTWMQPYNSKSCRITVHFPIFGRSIQSGPSPQRDARFAEAIDAFLDLLRSGDYGSRLAVKQEHE